MADWDTRFKNRQEAGRLLACLLPQRQAGKHPAGQLRSDALVLGLPRGGVVVAFELASALQLPMDIVLVRKLGVPIHAEFALGALASVGGAVTTVLSDAVIAREQVSDKALADMVGRESAELVRRARLYGQGRLPVALAGRHVIVADDGMATGSTMLAAMTAVRAAGVASVTVAVPVASREALQKVRRVSDDCVCLAEPAPFYAVAQYYDDFAQTSDVEVLHLLQQAQALRHESRNGPHHGTMPSDPGAVSSNRLMHKGDHRGL